jgi:hypothetical protein
VKKLLILIIIANLMLSVAGQSTYGYFGDGESSEGNTITAWVQVPVLKFFVADKKDNSLYLYCDSGRFTGSFALDEGNDKSMGVAVVGDYIYVLDAKDNRVYLYSTGGTTLAVSRELGTPAGDEIDNPSGLAISGDDMWIVQDKDYVFRYSLSEAFSGGEEILNAGQQIELAEGNKGATGLAIDGGYLYILDDDKVFFRYPHAGGEVTVSRTMKEEDGDKLKKPTGAMHDGTSLWVVDKSRGKIYQYDIGMLFTGSGDLNAESEFELDGDNGNPEGL